MIPGLSNHVWQSTLFAVLAALLALALRKNRAHIRHWIWLAASVKFLLPFALLVALGSHVAPRSASVPRSSGLNLVLDQVTQPFPVLPATAAWTPKAAVPWLPLLLAVWLCGVVAVSSRWFLRWRRIRAMAQAASPLAPEAPIPVRSSASLVEPGIFGVFRPVLLLPEGILQRLTPEQLRAIFAHEFCHLRGGQGRAEAQKPGDVPLPDRPAADSDRPPLLIALQEQPGLQVKSEKGPVEMFVIDRAERPSEN
jgi:bla regulator protein blaR1